MDDMDPNKEWNISYKNIFRSIQVSLILIFIGLVIRAAAVLILIEGSSDTKSYLYLHTIGLIIQIAGAVLLSYIMIGSAFKYKNLHPHIRAAMIVGAVIILAIALTSSTYPFRPYYY